MKRACRILLVSLLCSCTGPAGPGEVKTAESERVRFLDRSNPLVEHTFEIMEMRADRSYMREVFRAEGKRVCEEGETGTTWKEDCNDCRCDWGIRHCLNRPCRSPESVAKLRAEMQEHNRQKAERYRELREMDRARGVRVCEEGEHGTIWRADPYNCWCHSGRRYCAEYSPPPFRVRVCEEGKDGTTWREDPYTCWCDSGMRWCSEHGRPQPPDPEEEEFTVEPPDTFEYHGVPCEEDEIGTYWRWGCNTCWCEAGFRVCSKADCPSPYHPKGPAATGDTE